MLLALDAFGHGSFVGERQEWWRGLVCPIEPPTSLRPYLLTTLWSDVLYVRRNMLDVHGPDSSSIIY